MNAGLNRVKHSAPGQYLGFALQPVRAFHHLITCPKGTKVALELLDDVSVHYSDGTVYLEQTKSALSQNPLSDSAVDLWKTFANWVGLVSSGKCDAKGTRFNLYVSPCHAGPLSSALCQATSPEEIEVAIAAVRKVLTKGRKPPRCHEHLAKFLEADEHIQTAIVGAFSIETADDPLAAIRALLSVTVSEKDLDVIARSGIGQAKQEFDRLIQEGQDAIIDADDFKMRFRAFVARNNLPGLLVSLGERPDPSLIMDLASTRPTFVRQLEFVGIDVDEQLRAVSDFLRTSADKAEWAERGMIFAGSLDDWDEDLLRRHGLVHGEIEDLHRTRTAEERGRFVYRQCARLEPPLEGRAVPGHFVNGSFNDLADRQQLGWHVDYRKLLAGSDQ